MLMSPQVTPICRSYCATYSRIGKKTLAFRSQLYRSVAFPNLSTLFCFSYIFWAAKQATCTSASLRMCHSEEFAVPARSVSKATVQEQMQLLSYVYHVLVWEEVMFAAMPQLSIPEIRMRLGRVHIGQDSLQD